MIVVWEREDSAHHIFIAGAKRLGVLAATMVLSSPDYLARLQKMRRNIKGSFRSSSARTWISYRKKFGRYTLRRFNCCLWLCALSGSECRLNCRSRV
jgi:hypothetical protein